MAQVSELVRLSCVPQHLLLFTAKKTVSKQHFSLSLHNPASTDGRISKPCSLQ